MAASPAGAIMNTFVRTVWLPSRKSCTGVEARWRAIAAAGPNVSAWLGHTVAHMGRRPTDVRS